MGAGAQEMLDLAKDPRPSLRRAADHHRVRPGRRQHRARLFRRRDVAVGHHRDRRRRLDRGDGLVFGGAAIAVGTRAAMQGQHGDAAVLGDAGDRERVLVVAVPAGAELERHRHVHRSDHRLQDARHQRLVLQQGRAAPAIADLLDRAAHVDVDDLGAALDVVLRAFGQHGRIGAGDLHRLRLHLAGVVDAARGFFRSPQARIGRRHFRHRVAGAEPLAQLAERAIGDAGHGRHEDVIAQKIGADIHGRSISQHR